VRDVEDCGECSIIGNFGTVVSDTEVEQNYCDTVGSIFDSCNLDLSVTYKSYYYADETYKYTTTAKFKLAVCLNGECDSAGLSCGLEFYGDYSYEGCELRTEYNPTKCRQIGKNQAECRNSVFFSDPCDFIAYEDITDTGFDNSCKDLVYYSGSSESLRETRGNPASALVASFAVLATAVLALQF
tara:strand:- start:54 stop:608 length:555 start_codon:yes stop_codon:yes gene_type:complete